MYQKDFIMRMVEMLAELVSGILRLINKGEFEKATQSIDNAYRDLLKEDAAFFTSIPLDKLTDVLIAEHNYTDGHLEILSELFYTQAELLLAQSKLGESINFYKKALKLFNFVIKKSGTFSIDKQSKIQYIENRIAEFNIDNTTKNE